MTQPSTTINKHTTVTSMEGAEQKDSTTRNHYYDKALSPPLLALSANPLFP
jgi:hypothetical protein